MPLLLANAAPVAMLQAVPAQQDTFRAGLRQAVAIMLNVLEASRCRLVDL